MTAKTHAIKSTNVRTASNAVLRTFASIAPGAASAVGEWLFTHPRRDARPDREAAYLASATRVAFRSGGRDLAAWQWGSGDRTTLLVHGWAGRGSQLGAFAAPLVKAGHRVIAFDAPAHGDSAGVTTTIRALREAVVDAHERFGGLDAVIAHSMGAAALALAFEDGLSVSAAALIAPPVSPLPQLSALSDALGFGLDAHERLLERLTRRVGISPRDLDVSRIAPRLDVPALVVHDRRDRFVPWESGRAIANAWPGAQLISTEGLGHGRILGDADVVRAVTEFVMDLTPPGQRRDLDHWLDAVEGSRIRAA